jgi:hypothetical protein
MERITGDTESLLYTQCNFLAFFFVAHAQYSTDACMKHGPVENLWRFNLANVVKFCTNIFFNNAH